MPDTRLRPDALADDALAFLKPLVAGVWGAVAVGLLAMPTARAFAFQAEPVPVSSADAASIAIAGEAQ